MVLFLHHGRPHLHDAGVPWMQKTYTGIVIRIPKEASVPVFVQAVKGGCVVLTPASICTVLPVIVKTVKGGCVEGHQDAALPSF